MAKDNKFLIPVYKQNLIKRGFDIIDLISLPRSHKNDWFRFIIKYKINNEIVYSQCSFTNDKDDFFERMPININYSIEDFMISDTNEYRRLEFIKHQIIYKSMYTRKKYLAYENYNFRDLSQKLFLKYHTTHSFLQNLEKLDLDSHLISNNIA